MLDLFGEVIPPSFAVIEPAHGFAEFWSRWPQGPRKVAKSQCLSKWCSKGCADNAELVILHMEWMKTQPDWLKDNGAFICAPLVYLNQQRWVDFVPQAVKKRPDRDPELAKRDNDIKNAAPMPAHIREKIAMIRGNV